MRTYPLSPLHQQQLDASGQPAGAAFHTRQLSFSFGEAIDRLQLVAAWQDLTTTHPILRTALDPSDPNQWRESDDDITEWREVDWRTDPPADLGAAWNELAASDAATPVATGHRLTTIVLPSGGLHLLWSYDDLLVDEAALRHLLVEWLLRYEGGTRDATPDDPAAAFAAVTGHDSEEATWLAHFQNARASRPLILFPLPEENAPSTRRATVSHTFEREHGRSLGDAAETMNVAPIDLVEAAWALLLAPALSSDDVTLLATSRVAITAVARSETRLPRRHRLTPEAKVSAWAQAVAQTRAEAATVGTWTTEQIAAALPDDVDGAAATRPAAAFRYRSGDLNDHLHSCLPRWLGADAQFLGHDAAPLALIYTASDRATVSVDYDPGLFTETAASVLLKRWIAIIAQLVEDPDRTLREITIILPGEPTLVAGPEAAPAFRSLVPQCLHELFDETANEFGERTALDSESETLTFEALNQQANQVARHLRKLNVAARTTVALRLGYSSHWPVVILGIWKAGAAVSIHANDVKSSGKVPTKNAIPKLILSEESERSEGTTSLEDFWQKVSAEKTRGIAGDISATDPAIRLADGRTVSHEEAGRLCQAAAAALDVGPDDRFLQSAPAHDLETLAEIFGTLLSGATVVLPATGGWSTRTAFQEFAEGQAVTVLSVPTPFWSQWTHYLRELSLLAPASVRRAVIRGGRISPAALAAWSQAAPNATILHAGVGFHAPTASLEGSSGPAPNHPPAGAFARITWHDTPLPPGFPGLLEIGSSEETLTPTDREMFLDASGAFYSRDEIESIVRPRSATSRLGTLERVVFEHREIFDCAAIRTDSGTWNVWIVPADSQRGEPIDFRDHLDENLADLDLAVACIPRLPLTRHGELDEDALPPPTRERQVTRPSRPSVGDDTPTTPPSEDDKLASILSRALGGRDLDADTSITDAATKPRVALHLHETLQRAGYADAQLEDFQRVFSVRSLRREWRSRQSAADGKWNPLKPLHAAGATAPLIVFHDYAGTAELYRELTLHLGEDQPVYAITARGVASPSEPVDVTELADTYARAIRQFDSDAPYRLLGFGFGGILALETARCLNSQGQDIDFLCLLATEPPRANRGLAGGIRKFFGKKSPPTPRPGDSALVTAHRQAAFRHKVEPLDITTHIFLPEEDFPLVEDAQNDWTEICDDARFYQVPCAPADLLEEPAVTAIAEAIANLLADH